MRIVAILLIIGIVTGLAVTTSPAETMRRGTDFIKINDSAFIVEKKCGEPVSKIHIGYPIDGNMERELIIEEWVYGPKNDELVKSRSSDGFVKNGFYCFVTMTGGHVSVIRSERP
jgi:hypothetical protein